MTVPGRAFFRGHGFPMDIPLHCAITGFRMNMDTAEAYAACSALAKSHYENFPVGRLVPARLRPHVHAIYAFARVADDIADEGYADPRLPVADGTVLSQEQRLQQMRSYREELRTWLSGQNPDSPYAWIFLPLRQTAQAFQLPESLFYDLLSAFEQDIVKRRYETHAEVLDYCRRSANPIGRLVLLLHGYRQPELHALSDDICTALQLANFWQDVSVDLVKDRIYLPVEDQRTFGIDEKLLFDGRASEAFRACLKFQVDRTQELFDHGRSLSRSLDFKLAWEIRLTWLGGATILKKIRRQNYDTLTRRPKLTFADALTLVPRSLLSL